MREIVFDTETTGLSPEAGHRVVEIGAVELINHVPTGRTFWKYVNPERSMPGEAFAVHGLSDEFLSDKPVFAEIADSFLDFVGDARLVAHNAAFDMAFVNAELRRAARPVLEISRAVDSLEIARRRHPFGPNSLDALCRRYGIDNSSRALHGALLDSQLLAEVYLELIGGRQPHLTLVAVRPAAEVLAERRPARPRPEPLPPRLTAAEIAAHQVFVAGLGKAAIWTRYDMRAARAG